MNHANPCIHHYCVNLIVIPGNNKQAINLIVIPGNNKQAINLIVIPGNNKQAINKNKQANTFHKVF